MWEDDTSRNNTSNIIIHCLYGRCAETRKNEQYLWENCIWEQWIEVSLCMICSPECLWDSVRLPCIFVSRRFGVLYKSFVFCDMFLWCLGCGTRIRSYKFKKSVGSLLLSFVDFLIA
jgi:hypothetical protein